MSHARETTLTLFVMFLSPLMSRCPRFTFWLTFFSKLYVTFILQRIAFIFGKDEEDDQKVCHVQQRQLSLCSLCTYLP